MVKGIQPLRVGRALWQWDQFSLHRDGWRLLAHILETQEARKPRKLVFSDEFLLPFSLSP